MPRYSPVKVDSAEMVQSRDRVVQGYDSDFNMRTVAGWHERCSA